MKLTTELKDKIGKHFDGMTPEELIIKLKAAGFKVVNDFNEVTKQPTGVIGIPMSTGRNLRLAIAAMGAVNDMATHSDLSVVLYASSSGGSIGSMSSGLTTLDTMMFDPPKRIEFNDLISDLHNFDSSPHRHEHMWNGEQRSSKRKRGRIR